MHSDENRSHAAGSSVVAGGAWRRRNGLSAIAGGLAAACMLCHAAAAAHINAGSLTSMSLEELGNVRVTSVSRHDERLAGAPAAVFVISADDVRRSGAASLPEVLRLAPNLQVMRQANSEYVITARGFANNDGNKLLVLVDGRSVYTPLFSGVFWDAQGVMLDDIERIEVISGPGGTLWGTNAVNGVINIISKPAAQTQGSLLSAAAGTQLRSAGARHGGTFGANGAYRLYAQGFGEAATRTAAGQPVDDGWHKAQAGFRADWRAGREQFTAQGDLYRGRRGQPAPGSVHFAGVPLALDTITIAGANLMLRWQRALDGGAGLEVQAYLDRTERTVPPTYAEQLNIVDVQAQYVLAPLGAHALTAGVQLRHARDQVDNSEIMAFLPAAQAQTWSSLFAQDEISLGPGLRLTAGLRLERNGYTGTQWLPNLRLAWQRAPDSLLWTALSRTVRAPSRLDRDLYFPGQPPYILAGGAGFKPELATVLEAGYRGRAGNAWSYSVNLYRALYDRLRTQELAPGGEQVYFGNGMRGATRGIEAWGSYQASPAWRLSAGWTALHETLSFKPGSIDTAASLERAGRDPAHTWQLRSSLQWSPHAQFDATVRRVAALATPGVPAYTALDLRLGWQFQPGWDALLSGNNLFGGGHGEFSELATRSHLGRSVLLRLVHRF